ncbi:MAG: outer membrane lipoprotein carrier protein LolA [Treponema sp.]|nr:outer membrane lipoprotein carrier protein LolA [Treponema sp.]
MKQIHRSRPLLLLVLTLFFSSAAAGAQRAVPGADVTLDSVCRSLTEHPVTAGTFVMQRHIASLPRDLRSSGSFVICGEGIAWNTIRPVRTLLAVTGDKIIQRLPDGSTNVMDGTGNQTFRSIAATLSALFSGDRAALEDNFQVSFSPAGSSWTMTLLPKDRSVASVMTTIIMEGTQGTPAGTAATGGNAPHKTATGGGKSGGTPAETAATDGNAPHTTAPDAGEAFLTALSIDEAGGGRITYRFSDQEHRDTLTPDEKAYFTAD